MKMIDVEAKDPGHCNSSLLLIDDMIGEAKGFGGRRRPPVPRRRHWWQVDGFYMLYVLLFCYMEGGQTVVTWL